MSENPQNTEQAPVDVAQDLAIEELAGGEPGTTAVSTFGTIACSSTKVS
ncbi:hypothetical protein [Streptomyces bambusae]|uniref:Thiocillin family RiPP n=1 Tax=Streptomyces bambusae TaxID=1550616 RepID=A0ABS6ZBZ0_9ACTN|nr:hypothetical protein [Streptomyces bambusae]MBW5485262.1 hypothetical protein [Streptomyces bambusae]